MSKTFLEFNTQLIFKGDEFRKLSFFLNCSSNFSLPIIHHLKLARAKLNFKLLSEWINHYYSF